MQSGSPRAACATAAAEARRGCTPPPAPPAGRPVLLGSPSARAPGSTQNCLRLGVRRSCVRMRSGSVCLFVADWDGLRNVGSPDPTAERDLLEFHPATR